MNTLHNAEYREFVLNDLEKNAGLTHSRHALLAERLLVRKASPRKLHPNPEDEFSDPAIGPNDQIVGKYMRQFTSSKQTGSPLDDVTDSKRLTVEKIAPKGYRILNGHHRWLAACMVKKPTLPIKIVNITQENEILQLLNRTPNSICASFDLDEALLTTDGHAPSESRRAYPLGFLFRARIHEGASALIGELRRMGCDVWVYTGSFTSAPSIRRLLRAYGIQVNGVVNGVKKRKSGLLSRHFSRKYRLSLHIDNDSVMCVDTQRKTYEIMDLTRGSALWATETAAAVRTLIAKREAEA